MSPLGLVVAGSILLVGAGWAVAGALRPHARLADELGRLDGRTAGEVGAGIVDRVGAAVVTSPLLAPDPRWTRPLRLIGRTPAHHAGMLALAAVGGFVAPAIATALLTAAGSGRAPWLASLGVGVVGAIVAPLAIHGQAMADATDTRTDLRHQLSGYLDMVTMLLAGNTGHERALEQAAEAGDGVLFVELRRRMREAAATGQSLVVALARVADDLDLVELEQVAATTSLSAAEGAPVARTLAAKCTTLRSTLATDQEAAARIRTDKVTPPLVGMALLFMVLIIYPALEL